MEAPSTSPEKLEVKINLMKKVMHQPDFNQLSRHSKVLYLQELNTLQAQLKSLKKQKAKATQRKMYCK